MRVSRAFLPSSLAPSPRQRNAEWSVSARRGPPASTLVAFLGLLVACGDGSTADFSVDPPDLGVPVLDAGQAVGNALADAGPEQDVSRMFAVTLDGTESRAPSGGALTYRWTQVAGPDVTGGEGFLSGASPVFAAPSEVSTLVFSLTVDDGSGPSRPDLVQVNVFEDASAALFVDATEGDDETGNGTRARPWATLERAVAALSASREDLYLRTREGDAPYALEETLRLPTGTSLYGGYAEGWVRDVTGSPTTLDGARVAIRLDPVDLDVWVSGLRILAASTDDASADVAPLWADAGSAHLHVEDCELTGGDVLGGESPSPGSSYGLFASGVRAVSVRRSALTAGRGGSGAAGASGTEGPRGDGGDNASGNGRTSGGSGGPGGNGGYGGARGRLTFGNGEGGQRGFDAAGTQNGGSGGSGGSGDGPTDGATAGGGAAGAPGEPGAGASGAGSVDDEGGFRPLHGASGFTGGHGRGGGGGGGGEANFGSRVGGGGGGGGEGGEGGTGGAGGAGAGASIGLWLAAVDEAQVEACVIVATTGGDGGSGGEGGLGGSGGPGGAGAAGDCDAFSCGGRGGNGGSGGRGGKGGSGGGGGGGPSYGVFVGAGVAPMLRDCDIAAGEGGAGGSGGPDNAEGGDGGFAFGLFDADLEDGAVPALIGGTLSAGVAGAPGPGTGDGAPGAVGVTGRRNGTEAE